MVEERLDRALVTQARMNIFPHCALQNLVCGASEHSPIILSTEIHVFEYKKRQLWFENAWLIEREHEEVVLDSWSHGAN